MNLVLARSCSNSCPYCFEETERQGDRQRLISMENVARFARWARESCLGYLSLLGGEPFLHPELGNIVRMIRQVSPGTGLNILTGGIFNKRLLDDLSPDVVAIVFNVNEPGDYRNPKHFGKVLNNIDRAIRKGFVTGIGFNVWRTDFDAGFMPELAHRFGRVKFRWTIANPQWGSPSCVVKPAGFSELSKRCFEMLKEAARLNIEAILDCPLPLCFFDESQLSWVRQYHPGTAQRLGVCDPILDVTPELEVLRCFALSKLDRMKVTDFADERQIREWFYKHVDNRLLSGGCLPDCQACVHFSNGRCQGGCLAWHELAEPGEQAGAQELALQMQSAIEAGKPELATEYFENSDYWLKTDAAGYAAATALCQQNQAERAFRQAARTLETCTDFEIKRRLKELMLKIPVTDREGSTAALQARADIPFVSCPAEKNEVF